MRCLALGVLAVSASVVSSAADAPRTVLRGGTVYDGTGAPGRVADVAHPRRPRRGRRRRVAALPGDVVVDARGLAVAPGFINMLSWSTESLLVDGALAGRDPPGRDDADHRRGLVDGAAHGRDEAADEGRPGRPEVRHRLDDARRVPRSTSSGRASRRTSRRTSARPPSASTSIGLDDRPPTPAELDAMRALVAQEMEAGALGIGSSLIYAPGIYAKTEELIELCKVAARYQGKYISHLRSEGDRLLEAVDELIRISREAGLPAEIYHLKAAGEAQLAEDGPGDRAGRGGAQGGPGDHRRHVHVHRGRDRASTPACRRWSLEGGRARVPQAPARTRRRARAS